MNSHTRQPVWLVGAGPGDPDLLTRKAERLLREADIVFFDALVGPGVLALIPPTVRLVDVGKRAGVHGSGQTEINRMLVAAAASGARVVRLKGGDPSIFGRATEELLALFAAGFEVRVCPGVTAACAAAAAAGASLTLRVDARQVTFLTGQCCAGHKLDFDWPTLARARETLVVYMGRNEAAGIARRLIRAGRPGSTPVIVAVDVSLPTEQLVHTRLDAMVTTMLALPTDAPATLMIGAAFAAAAGTASRARQLALA